MAMTLVSTTTVPSGGAASIEFTNIPQTGKDLLLVCSLRQTTGSELIVEYNNFAGSYVTRTLGGDGTTVYSSSSTDAGVAMRLKIYFFVLLSSRPVMMP